jgi:hypothetical protein
MWNFRFQSLRDLDEGEGTVTLVDGFFALKKFQKLTVSRTHRNQEDGCGYYPRSLALERCQ